MSGRSQVFRGVHHHVCGHTAHRQKHADTEIRQGCGSYCELVGGFNLTAFSTHTDTAVMTLADASAATRSTSDLTGADPPQTDSTTAGREICEKSSPQSQRPLEQPECLGSNETLWLRIAAMPTRGSDREVSFRLGHNPTMVFERNTDAVFCLGSPALSSHRQLHNDN
ncbi:unnamed protein product [Schistocephalus solidus]|uniref:Uncharacterized protein n=1 Tax=Schistocephalus solidus TaxID=70667 RepID=A0A183SGE5_SCHSO|nr:unnamed protein product [Schistocephalus solidus]